MVSTFWHVSICFRAVKVFFKTSCTQIVRSLKKIILQTDWHDVARNFGIGELCGSGGRATALFNFRVVVLGLETR